MRTRVSLMKPELRLCAFEDLAAMLPEARKTRIIAADRKRVRWWQIMAKGEAVGFCGLLQVSIYVTRLVSCFVVRDHRGNGFGSFAVHERVRMARAEGYKRAEVRTFHPEYFARIGFREVRRFNSCGSMIITLGSGLELTGAS